MMGGVDVELQNPDEEYFVAKIEDIYTTEILKS